MPAAAAVQVRSTEVRIPLQTLQGNTALRKPVDSARDIFANKFHNRPAAFALRESGPRILREWSGDPVIRELSRKYRVRSRDIEALLKAAVAALLAEDA